MAWKTKLAELLVEIKAPLGPLKSAMSKAAAIVKRGMKTLSRWARRGAVAIGVGLAAAMVWAIKKAMIQEDAEIALAAALRKTGDATVENIASFKKYAAELQKLTIYGDEEILTQMAYAKNLGVSTDKLKEAAKAAIGLAATYKLELSAAMMLVGRASQGQTQMLTRYGIVLREGLTDQQKFNEVLRIGADGFTLAEEAAKTTRGTLTRLWNVIGDIAERIAGPLLKRLKEVAESMLVWVDANEKLIASKTGEWIDKLVKSLEWLKPKILKTAKYWKAILGVGVAVAIAPGIAAIGKIVAALGKGIAKLWAVNKALRYTTVYGKVLLSHGIKIIKESRRLSLLTVTYLRLGKAIGTVAVAIKTAAAATVTFLASITGALVAAAVAAAALIITWNKILKLRDKEELLNQKATPSEIKKYQDEIRETEKYKKMVEKKAAAKKKIDDGIAKREKDLKDKADAEKEDIAKNLADKEEKRDVRVSGLEKQLAMYKEMSGYADTIADIESELRKERARDISKELDMGSEDVQRNLDLKYLRELENESKKAEAEAAQAAKDKITERASLYRDELSYLEALFTDAVGFEKQLADVKKRIRKEEAKDIAAATKVSYKDALKILDTKIAAASIKVGLVGIEQAWGQIATGVNQTEKAQLRETQKQTKILEKIKENTTDIKQDNGGLG